MLDSKLVVLALATVKLPKSAALPVDWIVKYSITLTAVAPALCPPCDTPLVASLQAEFKRCNVAISPKSAAFPVEAIVIYSIFFPVPSPPNEPLVLSAVVTPLVKSEHPAALECDTLWSPKLAVVPCVLILKKS